VYKEDFKMRTNIVIEDNLIEEGLAYTGLKTKRELVHYALKELVDRKKRKAILGLEGKLHWEGNLKEMRENRFEDIG
jgi:Arc/MetJ family transcription regulator